MMKVAVVQSLISSEVAIPLDAANILSVSLKHNLPASFHDLNHQDEVPVSDLIYLSAYTVVPNDAKEDFPLLLKSLKSILSKAQKKIVVGSYRMDPDRIGELLNAGAHHVLVGDTADLFAEVISGNSNPILRKNKFESLHHIIPDFSPIPLPRYRKSIMSRGKHSVPFSFSRGCGVGCSYCPVTNPYEQMTLPEIKKALSVLSASGVNHLMIEDDLFNFTPEFVEQFCDLMNDFSGMTWECLNGLHPSRMNAETWNKLARSQCVHLTFGFECFNQKFLSSKGRHYDLDEALRGVAILTGKGMAVSGYFLFDFILDSGSLGAQLAGMKRSPITLFHFSSLRQLTLWENILRSVSLIYLHCDPNRLSAIVKMGFFSGNYFVRSVKKIIRARA
jgi:radical SAM superfamily enzyme YgiQ (UPF0313 family)